MLILRLGPHWGGCLGDSGRIRRGVNIGLSLSSCSVWYQHRRVILNLDIVPSNWNYCAAMDSIDAIDNRRPVRCWRDLWESGSRLQSGDYKPWRTHSSIRRNSGLR
jgi:hypothetical protein